MGAPRAGEGTGSPAGAEAPAGCELLVWGRTDYDAAVAWMERRVEARRDGAVPDALVLCEHDPVITLGRNAKPDNIVQPADALRRRGIAVRECGRGGDVTWHGPGQLVGYPVVQLEPARHDARAYLRDLEEVLLRALAEFGIAAGRRDGLTGVWVSGPGGDRKIASLGVRLSRWITSHGFALNVCCDLAGFEAIVPCGIAGCRMVTAASLAGRPLRVADFIEPVARHFGAVFGRSVIPRTGRAPAGVPTEARS